MIDAWIRESNLIEDIDDPIEDKRSQSAWEWLAKQPLLNVATILGTHKRITRLQLGSEAGHFRTCRVWVGGREGAPWNQVPHMVSLWLTDWAGRGVEDIQHEQTKEVWFKQAHVKFEKIHPFVDGNGRTGRMIMNWQRERAGLKPLLIKKSEVWQYYDWFRDSAPL